MSTYRNAPSSSDAGVPKGIPYIVTNEAAERFSFYGMKGILVVFMTKYLLDSSGDPDVMSEEQAKVWYHNFTSAVYFFPILGALIADWFLGKYRTILYLSTVYCVGHLCLAFMDLHMPLGEPRDWLFAGLVLIAVGSGGIKPCVSAHVGDQFGRGNAHLLEKIFGWFYFSINLGAFASTLLTPYLLNHPSFGPAYAFGLPGVLMGIATFLFWMGRNTFIHIPAGGSAFLKEIFSKKGFGSLARLLGIYLFVAMFWALFDQTGSSWVFQAQQMDRYIFGIELLPSQIQALNPILILLFIPLFNFVIYPSINKVFPLTPLRKIGIGFFLTVPAFLLPAWIEHQIAAGDIVAIEWQLFSYVLITAAEVFVSITALEFSYTQSPTKMKSFVMAAYLLGVSVGNQFVSVVNSYIQNPTPQIEIQVPGDYVFSLTTSDAEFTETKSITVHVLEKRLEEAKSVLTESPQKEFQEPKITFLKEKMYLNLGSSINLFSSLNTGDTTEVPLLEWTAGSTAVQLKDDGRSFNQATISQLGTHTVSLKATIGTYVASAEVELVVVDKNLPPIIALDEEQDFILYTQPSLFKGLFCSDCMEKETLFLNASGTIDPNGDDLKHSWEIVSQPSGSTLSSENIKGRVFAYATNKIDDVQYYLFFAGCMFLTALFFIPYAMRYRGETYIQDGEETKEA
jgi:POT family proton-dependent oligopeptide transporter